MESHKKITKKITNQNSYLSALSLVIPCMLSSVVSAPWQASSSALLEMHISCLIPLFQLQLRCGQASLSSSHCIKSTMADGKKKAVQFRFAWNWIIECPEKNLNLKGFQLVIVKVHFDYVRSYGVLKQLWHSCEAELLQVLLWGWQWNRAHSFCWNHKV